MKEKILNYLGYKLLAIGMQLIGYKTLVIYQPEGDEFIRAMHVAENQQALNTSMRIYVDSLDESYLSKP